MTIIGPRPFVKAEQDQLPSDRLCIKPGLTGYWQAYAGNDALYKTGERQKMELYYVHNKVPVGYKDYLQNCFKRFV